MSTLRDLWEDKRMTPTEVAGLSRISVTTLYKMNKKNPKDPVSDKTIRNVCKALNISVEDYEKLDPGQ